MKQGTLSCSRMRGRLLEEACSQRSGFFGRRGCNGRVLYPATPLNSNSVFNFTLSFLLFSHGEAVTHALLRPVLAQRDILHDTAAMVRR
jgi:hypothetical protein